MITLVLGGGRSGKSASAEKLAVETGKKTVYIATAVPFDDEMKKRIRLHQEQRPRDWATIEMYHEFRLTTDGEGLSSEAEGHFRDSGCVLLDSLGMMVNNILFDCGVGFEHSQNDQEAEPDGIFSGNLRNLGNIENLRNLGNIENLRNLGNPENPGNPGKPFSAEITAEKAVLRSLETLIETCREQEKDLILVAEEVGMGIVPETYLTRCYRDILGSVNKRAATLADRVYFVVAGIEMKIK